MQHIPDEQRARGTPNRNAYQFRRLSVLIALRLASYAGGVILQIDAADGCAG